MGKQWCDKPKGASDEIHKDGIWAQLTGKAPKEPKGGKGK